MHKFPILKRQMEVSVGDFLACGPGPVSRPRSNSRGRRGREVGPGQQKDIHLDTTLRITRCETVHAKIPISNQEDVNFDIDI